ncbi:hypothetical protein, partial [Bartonella sp. MR168JLCBS]
MALTLSFMKYFFSQQTSSCRLTETNSPLRSTYKSQDELYELGHNIASGEEILIPEYEKSKSFHKRLNENA